MPLSRSLRVLPYLAVLTLGLGLAAGVPRANAMESVESSEQERFSAHPSELAMRAMSLIGVRYKYGGSEPEDGLDCSGLVRYLFREVLGADLPRTSLEISRLGEAVDKRQLQPGDLVFYNTLRQAFSHVGIYLGDNRFIHAPASGGQVRIERMDVGYWRSRFNGARRLGPPD